jgi:FkbH-like protein
MKSSSIDLEQALGANSAAQMRALLTPRTDRLSLVEVMRLGERLESLSERRQPLRLGIIHTYTSEPLDPYLGFEAALQGFALAVHHAPYGVVLQETQAGSALREFAPDLILMLLRWDDLAPALARPLAGLDAAAQRDLAAAVVESTTRMVAAFRDALAGHIVLTLLPAMYGPALGIYDASAQNSEGVWRARVKADLVARLAASVASVTLLDLDEIVAEGGRRRFFDARWWYTSRFPFTPEGAQHVTRRVIALAAAAKLPRAKVIVVDADNTLWGGIIGEDGINGIALGPDYPGNAYVDFQTRLLGFQQRGFLLALCSKNNPDDVRQVLREHPHQVLREEHFASMRVGWERKVDNLRAIAEELDLGFDAFVFVDDSAHECLQVRQALPMIEVVQVPGRATDIPTCLDAVARLEVLAITGEDRRRTELYVQERRRRQMAETSSDVESYLRSLEMRMTVGVDDTDQVARISQLTQKTNQFNLTTRRYSAADVRRMMGAPDWLVAHFTLADIFGDSGLVGVALVRIVDGTAAAELDTLLMSCRVIGRRAETAFLETVLALLRARGVRTVVAEYLPTPKNQLVEKFLPDHGFSPGEGGRFTRNLTASTGLDGLPIVVQVATPAVGR